MLVKIAVSVARKNVLAPRYVWKTLKKNPLDCFDGLAFDRTTLFFRTALKNGLPGWETILLKNLD